jgi:transketolase
MSKSGHIGSSLSCVDLLVALYFDYLRVSPDAAESPNRDRFIMSKGHACAAFYAVLCRKGFFDRSVLESYAKNDGFLGHHPHRCLKWGIEASTGSLGHGLSLGAGMAFSAIRSSSHWRTVVMLSDGEINEGTVWEAALFAGHNQLSNLIAIVDCNKIQALGSTREIAAFDDLKSVWSGFGWNVKSVDGHNIKNVLDSLSGFSNSRKPSVLIAETIKGKGVSFMEDQLLWHYRCPDPGEYERAIEEVKNNA